MHFLGLILALAALAVFWRQVLASTMALALLGALALGGLLLFDRATTAQVVVPAATMTVRMPDGTLVHDVPTGASKADVLARLQAQGRDTSIYQLAPTRRQSR